MVMLLLGALETEEDRKSFEDIYEKNRSIMYNCAYSVLKDCPSAEDAVQDAFLALARNFEKTGSMNDSQIRSYLLISVRNFCYKTYNKRKREIATEDIFLDGEDTSDIPCDTENRELYKKLFELIRSLDKKYGDVIILKYYCDLRDKDIAEDLDISLENVKVRLHRAKGLLKSGLKGDGYSDR